MRLSGYLLKGIEMLSTSAAGKISFRMFCSAKPAALRTLEADMMAQSQKKTLLINGLRVSTYQWGQEGKPVLLLHGWESRASRFYLFIKELRKNGYQVISFDAPGHGESEGNSTTILENYEIIKQLQEKYGPFEAIIAHSLGVLNAFFAAKQAIAAKSIIAISGVSDFSYLAKKYAAFLGIKEKTHQQLRKYIEHFFLPRTNIWTTFSAHCEPEKLRSHICIIHDKNDDDVEISQSELLYSAYREKASMHVTNTLGHLRILSNLEVIKLSLHHIKTISMTIPS